MIEIFSSHPTLAQFVLPTWFLQSLILYVHILYRGLTYQDLLSSLFCHNLRQILSLPSFKVPLWPLRSEDNPTPSVRRWALPTCPCFEKRRILSDPSDFRPPGKLAVIHFTLDGGNERTDQYNYEENIYWMKTRHSVHTEGRRNSPALRGTLTLADWYPTISILSYQFLILVPYNYKLSFFFFNNEDRPFGDKPILKYLSWIPCASRICYISM